VYWPNAQNPWPGIVIAVCTSLDPGSVAKSIQKEVLQIDPDQPVAAAHTMEQLLGTSLA